MRGTEEAAAGEREGQRRGLGLGERARAGGESGGCRRWGIGRVLADEGLFRAGGGGAEEGSEEEESPWTSLQPA